MAKARLRMPAYGKRLLEERRGGNHPLEVTVVYGDRGFDVAEPKLWIKPEEFEPGKYDFRMLAGLHVTVMDQLGDSGEINDKVLPPTFGKFYDLIAEVAAADTYVDIEFPETWNVKRREADALAACYRWMDLSVRRMAWPRWWSDAAHQAHERRKYRWLNHRAYELGYLKRPTDTERERGATA